MKNIQILLILTILGGLLMLAACGGAAGVLTSAPKLDLKANGKDVSMEAKSTTVYSTVMTYTEKPRGDGIIRSKKGTSHSIFLTNFDIAPNDLMKAGVVPTAEGQIYVRLNFINEEGTDEKTPIKVGTYTTAAEQFMKFDGATIKIFDGGKVVDATVLSMGKKADGELKITGVTADEVKGEVNVTDGTNSLKGSFAAKLPKK